jgi:hypothetical protein
MGSWLSPEVAAKVLAGPLDAVGFRIRPGLEPTVSSPNRNAM